jgi:(1->4)-alpha-D-glucan 1-alpha-D-glucosylmutase
LHAGFGFADAAAVADYLADLGISHLYCSPYLQAAPGSTHGYDVVNPHQVNKELGGPEAHAQLCATLKENGLGQVLDIVPNHMAIAGRENPWWWDVLENGPSSRYAGYFDLEWDPPKQSFATQFFFPCWAIIMGGFWRRANCDWSGKKGASSSTITIKCFRSRRGR